MVETWDVAVELTQDDSSAVDYFSRAAGLGGIFAGEAYSEATTKSVYNDFVVSAKDLLFWDKLTEVYALIGVSFGGVLAKLKHAGTPTLINNGPFVTGDYVQAGSGAGLKGGSAKYLSGLARFTSPTASYGWYCTEATLLTDDSPMGATNSDFTVRALANNAGGWLLNDIGALVDTRPVGQWTVSRTSTDLIRVYQNGSSVAQNLADKAVSSPTESPYLFARNRADAAEAYTDARLSVAYLATGFTDTDAANYNTSVQALITALGAAV